MKILFTKSKLPLTILVAILVVATACRKNLLDRNPQGQYTQDDYPYPTGGGPYDAYLFAAYSELRAYNVHSQFFIAATSIRSDDADKGSTPGDGGANVQTMDNFPVLPSNGYTDGLWVGHYALINRCNITIDQIRNNADIVATTVQKTQAEAEAKFLRGYAYFNLVRYFGRVPIVDTIFSDPAAQANVPQSQPAQVYAFIESDLVYAAANLPPTWAPPFTGRVTMGAANGILAKVYLTQQKWAQALAAASAVINSGIYDLNTPYSKIFGEEGENSSESVFEVQATANARQKEGFGVQYVQPQGLRGVSEWNLGWGWNTPSDQLEAAYEPGDPRKARTFLYLSRRGQNGQADTLFQTVYGEQTPFWARNPNSSTYPNKAYNHKAYTHPSWRASVQHNFGYWMNVRILRYADVVLMYAEAANELGMTQEALDKLEMVRARARAGNNAILPRVTTTDQTLLRDAIRRERRVELAMEHDRFWDIVRWGIAQQVLHAAGKTNFNPARDNYLPIPQVQIDLSKGVLTQNPNY